MFFLLENTIKLLCLTLLRRCYRSLRSLSFSMLSCIMQKHLLLITNVMSVLKTSAEEISADRPFVLLHMYFRSSNVTSTMLHN